MIRRLADLGVEVEAIEQPVDLKHLRKQADASLLPSCAGGRERSAIAKHYDGNAKGDA